MRTRASSRPAVSNSTTTSAISSTVTVCAGEVRAIVTIASGPGEVSFAWTRSSLPARVIRSIRIAYPPLRCSPMCAVMRSPDPARAASMVGASTWRPLCVVAPTSAKATGRSVMDAAADTDGAVDATGPGAPAPPHAASTMAASARSRARRKAVRQEWRQPAAPDAPLRLRYVIRGPHELHRTPFGVEHGPGGAGIAVSRLPDAPRIDERAAAQLD